MEVFRITLEKWSNDLVASGLPARWNSKGNVIYTASSRALACLENLVHRRGRGREENFKTMVIHIPDDLVFEIVNLQDMEPGWNVFGEEGYTKCRLKGDEWLLKNASCVLSVPSAIIINERNYLISTSHPDFGKIEITAVESFFFDPRL